MRTLTEFNRTRVGLMGGLVTLLAVGVGQSFTSVPMLFATPTYYAQFADTGGISVGDKVEIAGVNVGLVRSLVISGDRVLVGFSMPGKTIGTQSRAAIRTDTFLGRKNMAIQPRGPDALRPNGIIPSGQTTTPYQIYDAFVDVTKAATDWNIDVVKRSLNVLSETFDQTAPHLKAALDGVAKFSGTIGKRDDQIKRLLTNADKVTRVLGDRSQQVDSLLVNANTLLAAFRQRSQALSILLSNVSSVSTQVSEFIKENPNAHHVLLELGTVSDELVKRKQELSDVLLLVSRYTASLTEAVASGPFFKAIVANLIPAQVLQPWLDAAFKKRGIDPENFWRSAGLPAFRWPDPNGTRFPNGAPPPGPPVLEGTPDHPRPAVPPGSPCSYAPAPDSPPRPGNPLPCALSDQGPFGAVLGGFPAPLDVAASQPNPDGPPPAPGIPSARRPGEAPPDIPGTVVPLPEHAPPGARTENLRPAGPTPPPSTLAPGLPPGPPAAPGPGPQLPAPFITPDGTGDR
ncbi:virulence factor Mce family protein [Mycobacterium sp. E2479]|uniref:virulence factor Mce family protein n=1 Tax=Mycobacterium sp. E2479 TaxID=1834134 RepID=UPI000800D48E|nr:virulence factor Mce family protein [Mycobacterium sp. E2479]OBH58402.1 mammalian cell entry protein [Mycobacterium sp. E2479]